MPGIAAFVSWDGAADGEERLRRLLGAMPWRGADVAVAAVPPFAWIGVLAGAVATEPGRAFGVDGRFADVDTAVRVDDGASDGDFAALAFEGGRLIAARDALGQRPLFWAETEGGIALASEARPLLALGARPFAADSIDAFVRGARVRGTFYRGVERLPAGHVLVATRAGVTLRRWWRPEPTARPAPFRALLREAVSRRLDAPTLVMASGGLDSSSIAALAAELRPDTVLASATFEGTSADERPWIDAVAATTRLRLERFDGAAPGEPTGDGDTPYHVALPSFLAGLERVARAHATRAVLSGLGGDELLFERGVFRDLAAHRRWPALLVEAWRAPRYSVMPARHWLRDAFRRERDPALRARWPSETQRMTWQWLENVDVELDERLAARRGLDVRYPFLDARLAEHVLATPWTERIPSGRMKILLRRAMARDLPDAIVSREHVTTFDGVLRDALDAQLSWIEEHVARGPWRSARWVERRDALRLLRRVQNDRARRMSWDDAAALWYASSLEAWLRSHQGIV